MKLNTPYAVFAKATKLKVLRRLNKVLVTTSSVPTQMIHSIESKSPSVRIEQLGNKIKLVARLRNAKYDGFRLTLFVMDKISSVEIDVE